MSARVWSVSCILLAWTAAGCAESRPQPVPPAVEELVLTADGSPIHSTSFYPPQVSRDGRIVAVSTSADNNLAPDCSWCIHVFDRDAGGPASTCPDLLPAREWRLSEDGRYVLDWTSTGDLQRVDWRTCSVEVLPRGAGRSEGSVAILPDGSGFVWLSRRMAVVTFDGGDVERIERGPWDALGARYPASIVPSRDGRAFLLGFRVDDIYYENAFVDFDSDTRVLLPPSKEVYVNAPEYLSRGSVPGFFADDGESFWMVRRPTDSTDATDLEQYGRGDLMPTFRLADDFRWRPQFMRPLDDGRVVYVCDIEPEANTLPAACILYTDGTTGPVRAIMEEPDGLGRAAVAPGSHELIFLDTEGDSLSTWRVYAVSLDGY